MLASAITRKVNWEKLWEADRNQTVVIVGILYINRSATYFKLGNNNLAINDLKTAAKLGDERAKNFLRSQGINW